MVGGEERYQEECRHQEAGGGGGEALSPLQPQEGGEATQLRRRWGVEEGAGERCDRGGEERRRGGPSFNGVSGNTTGSKCA